MLVLFFLKIDPLKRQLAKHQAESAKLAAHNEELKSMLKERDEQAAAAIQKLRYIHILYILLQVGENLYLQSGLPMSPFIFIRDGVLLFLSLIK